MSENMLLKDKVAILLARPPHAVWVLLPRNYLLKRAKVVTDLNGEVAKPQLRIRRRSSRLAANVADEVQVQAAIEQIMAKYMVGRG